jgi:hypothetical protein
MPLVVYAQFDYFEKRNIECENRECCSTREPAETRAAAIGDGDAGEGEERKRKRNDGDAKRHNM